MMFGIEPPKGADPPWHWGARAIYMRSDPSLRLAQAKKLKKGQKAPVPRVLDLLPDRQDFVVKDGIDRSLALDTLNRAWRKILDAIEERFHTENLSPSSGELFEGTYEAEGLPCVYGYTFRPAGGYVYLGIWPVEKKVRTMSREPRRTPSDLTEDELVGTLNSILDVLYPNGDAAHSWSPDTLSDIERILHRNELAPLEDG